MGRLLTARRKVMAQALLPHAAVARSNTSEPDDETGRRKERGGNNNTDRARKSPVDRKNNYGSRSDREKSLRMLDFSRRACSEVHRDEDFPA